MSRRNVVRFSGKERDGGGGGVDKAKLQGIREGIGVQYIKSFLRGEMGSSHIIRGREGCE